MNTKKVSHRDPQRKHGAFERRVGQSSCRGCKRPIHPGSGIVRRFGAGGRICKNCNKNN